MKKKISIIAIIILLVVLILSATCYSNEIQPRTSIENEGEPTSNLPQDEPETPEIQDYEITYSDLYVIEDKDYEMNKIMDGNAYIMVNGDVKITGEINGSAFIFANGTVEFTEGSYVADSLYIFAKEVKVNGRIYDIYAFTQRFEIMEKAYISRDIRVSASDIKLRGTIYRNAFLDATNIDIKDDKGSLVIGGDFKYTSKNKIEGLEDIVLYGEIEYKEQETVQENKSIAEKIRDYVANAISSIIYALAIYFILKLIAPKFTESIGKDLKEKTLVAFGVGILAWIIILIALIISIVLLFTTVGFPISIIAWIIMLVAIYISSAVLSVSIANIAKEKIERIRKNKSLEIGSVAVIALCLWILQSIPYLGGIIRVIVLTLGLGLIIRNIITKKEIDTNIEETEKAVDNQ